MATSGIAMEPEGMATFVDRGVLRKGSLKRWDGAARTCYEWDASRRVCITWGFRYPAMLNVLTGHWQDNNLWFRGGNCLVFLYGKGDSRRGPSFKVPLQQLINSKCYPLIQKFLHTDQQWPRTPENIDRWCHMNGRGAVELYIPPVSRTDASRNQAFRVAVRNIFAWAFQRSLVGEHLGPALVELLDSMYEYRSEGCDNDQDMMSYLDEEGYLDIANQPDHALAMLYMAETLRMRDLYIRAFVHCVGMHHQLYSSSEYEVSRLLQRKMSDGLLILPRS